MSFEGKYVIARSSQSGVWFGKLLKKYPDGDGTVTVCMVEARRIFYWEGAGSCAGLADHGLSGESKVTSPVSVMVSGVCEIIEAKKQAVEVLINYTVLRGDE